MSFQYLLGFQLKPYSYSIGAPIFSCYMPWNFSVHFVASKSTTGLIITNFLLGNNGNKIWGDKSDFFYYYIWNERVIVWLLHLKWQARPLDIYFVEEELFGGNKLFGGHPIEAKFIDLVAKEMWTRERNCLLCQQLVHLAAINYTVSRSSAMVLAFQVPTNIKY